MFHMKEICERRFVGSVGKIRSELLSQLGS